jgi:hypothetical protein
MAKEYINVGSYLINLVEENRGIFEERYKENIKLILDFINVVSEDCENKNVFLEKLHFIKLNDDEVINNTSDNAYSDMLVGR